MYLKKEFISQATKEQYITLVQLMRMSNQLEFWMGLYKAAPKEKGPVFEHKHEIEIDFMIICCYKEATKVFCKEMCGALLQMNLSDQLKHELSEYKTWLDNYKNDRFLKVVEKIRNDLRFHLKKDIYKGYVKDGEHHADSHIGYTIGDTYEDSFYVEPYKIELEYLVDSVPNEACSDRDKRFTWISNTAREKSTEFLRLIRKILREILKGNVHLEKMPVS